MESEYLDIEYAKKIAPIMEKKGVEAWWFGEHCYYEGDNDTSYVLVCKYRYPKLLVSKYICLGTPDIYNGKPDVIIPTFTFQQLWEVLPASFTVDKKSGELARLNTMKNDDGSITIFYSRYDYHVPFNGDIEITRDKPIEAAAEMVIYLGKKGMM
jgi:hypothetical protein